VVSDETRLPAGAAALVVEDTRLALGWIAAVWRRRFTLPVLAVTGSNGKTTTKEMIAAILKAAFGNAVLATRGNLNNDIGLPLTLLGLNAGHRAAVIEMGMNHPGEIAYLAPLGAPTVAVVTNAQRAHLEGMGDLDEVAREKGAIYGGLTAGGVAVINADDAYADYWRGVAAPHAVLTFAIDQAADVRGEVRQHGLDMTVHLTAPQGEADIPLRVLGRHNARNAVAATRFFDIPTDNLYASPVMVRDIKERFELSKLMVVSPDVGGVVRARGLAKRINAPLAIIDKRRERAGESEVMNVIGDVEGRTCILVDDIVDSGGTLVNAADALLGQGAGRVTWAFLTTAPQQAGRAGEQRPRRIAVLARRPAQRLAVPVRHERTVEPGQHAGHAAALGGRARGIGCGSSPGGTSRPWPWPRS